MSSQQEKPEIRAYPGFGAFALRTLGYNQTVRIGNIIKISGQGGWNPATTSFDDINLVDDIDKQIDQAFANVEIALKDAGGKGWTEVYSIRTLHVGLDGAHGAAVTRNFGKWYGEREEGLRRRPIWTQYGVAALGHPAMKVEIEVEAYVE